MSDKDEALRLANSLAAHSLSRHGQTQAAAELRRLYAECEALREFVASMIRCRYPVCPTIDPSGYGWDIPRLNEVLDAAIGDAREAGK